MADIGGIGGRRMLVIIFDVGEVGLCALFHNCLCVADEDLQLTRTRAADNKAPITDETVIVARRALEKADGIGADGVENDDRALLPLHLVDRARFDRSQPRISVEVEQQRRVMHLR